MIRSLHIENFALISRLDLTFDAGLTAVTGETGSGKSILVQAISMLRGEPADGNSIREGESVAVIEAECRPRDMDSMVRFLNEIDVEPNRDENLIVRREINRKGRNRFLVNDQAVSRPEFLRITEPLIEINSQHEHQILLQPRNHLGLFDEAVQLTSMIEDISRTYAGLRDTTTEIDGLRSRLDAIRQRSDLIRFQMTEIDQAGLQPDEKDGLIAEQQRLRYAEEIIRALNEADHLLGDSEDGISCRISPVIRSLQKAASRDSDLGRLTEQSEALSVIVEDLHREVCRCRDRVNVSPERLEQVNERLHFLQNMEGRYRNSIAGILEYRRRIELERESISESDHQLEALNERWIDQFQEYVKRDRALSRERRERVPSLCRRIESALAELGMERARFEVEFGQDRAEESVPSDFRIPGYFSSSGTDTLEFILSANPGIPLKPLVRVASGGELSRITLAMKQHLLSKTDADSVVFDEVDSGIGGQTAVAVARQLHQLSRDRQILCITHLPQLAVAADHHIVVRKSTTDEMTRVSVDELDRDSRLQEIARMLTGSEADSDALHHAHALIEAIDLSRSDSK